jgi:dihydrofolate reductase
MSKILVSNFITIDGFYDSEGGSMNEVFAHRWSGYSSIDEFDNYNLSLLEHCGTLILGKSTFLGNKSYWSSIDATSSESVVRKKLANRFREIRKIVVGSSIDGRDLEGWGPAEFTPRTSYLDYLRQEKAKEGRDFLVMMSRLMWNEMLQHQLIDEVNLTVFPMALGSGRPIFVSQPDCAFRLKESKVFPDAGNVLLSYEVIYE